jgi:hypothetical protein
MKVTKEFLQGLKSADAITFHNKTVCLHWNKKERNGKVFQDAFQSFDTDIRVNNDTENKKVCFHIGLYPSLYNGNNGVIGLLRKFLKANDEIEFYAWTNNSGYLDKAEIPSENWNTEEEKRYHSHYYGLYNDELLCNIIRNEKVIIQHLVIDSTICPNNTARGIANF